MVESQPQQEERVRKPLETIAAVKTADQQSSREQPPAGPPMLSPCAPQQPAGPQRGDRLQGGRIPTDFAEGWRGRAASNEIDPAQNTRSPRQHRAIPTTPAR